MGEELVSLINCLPELMDFLLLHLGPFLVELPFLSFKLLIIGMPSDPLRARLSCDLVGVKLGQLSFFDFKLQIDLLDPLL